LCGRFALSIIPASFQRVFGVAPPEGYRARWNIAPETPVLTVRAGEGGTREAVPVRWGMLGPWMKDPKDPGRQINARSESAAEKPMFRAAFRQHRCVIPADGFYEWQKGEGGPSRPFFVRRRDGEPLAFAGLWQPVRLESGERLETCAILTTAASPLLSPIHSRMPVMLRPDAIDAWLDPEVRATELLQALLEQPLPDAELESYEVGRAVNSPRHDGPELAERQAAEPPGPAQARLL
jgi:putative SOS response-associated peptidase YedK